MLNLNYHDIYWQSAKYGIPRMDPAAFLKTVYAAMKPGAVIGVIDHVASPNSDTRATVEKLHRIDPEVIKADFKRAGFVLVGTSDMLRNPADDHSLLVFDPKIRGKTDRVDPQVQEAALSEAARRQGIAAAFRAYWALAALIARPRARSFAGGLPAASATARWRSRASSARCG